MVDDIVYSMCSTEETDEYRDEFGDGVVSLVNLTEVDSDAWSVYIGRSNSYYSLEQSVFANPYTVDEYEREEAVRLYELWLFEQLVCEDSFYEAFTELVGESLACWCLPKLCHGEVLARAVVAYSNDELEEHMRSRFETIEVSLFGYSEEKTRVRGVLEEGDVLSSE